MTVRVAMTGAHFYRVTGAGYAPVGQIQRAQNMVEALDVSPPGTGDSTAVRLTEEQAADLHQLLTCACYCNNARLVTGMTGEWKIVGDPTEGVLLVLAAKGGETADLPRRIVHEIPFDSQRKAMSVVAADGDALTLYCKGALEVVLEQCDAEFRDGQPRPLDASRRQEIATCQAAFAEHALRVLAFAYRDAPEPANGSYQERGLTFLGIVGMTDPARDEARVAIGRCRRAGIRPVMITGDHPFTARAVAAELQLLESGDRVLTGQDLDHLAAAQLTEELPHVAVFSRVPPSTSSRS